MTMRSLECLYLLLPLSMFHTFLDNVSIVDFELVSISCFFDILTNCTSSLAECMGFCQCLFETISNHV